jgi:hypothetical protein
MPSKALTDFDTEAKERHTRALARRLVDNVAADQLDAVIALLQERTGQLPPRRAVSLCSVTDAATRLLIAESFPELSYQMIGDRGENGQGTVLHTWTCQVTGAFVQYSQGPDGCTVVENNGALGRHLWDDLVGLFTSYEMAGRPATDYDAQY